MDIQTSEANRIIYPSFKDLLDVKNSSELHRWLVIHNPDVPINTLDRLQVKYIYEQYKESN